MIHIKKSRAIWQVVFVALLMVVALGITATSISAATKTSQKTMLKKTINYCDKLDQSKYTSTSWKTFQKELTTAKTVYKKKSKDTVYGTALEKLEKAKANLMFVTSKDKGNPAPYRDLSVSQMVGEMGTGWNLGNTMDMGNELNNQKSLTTKAFIKAVHDSGFNTIRVPVTWQNWIKDSNNFEIDAEWMSRVQDIVDYAISQDMFVILNLHHDGLDKQGWIDTDNEDIDSVYNKYENVVRHIAEHFKDYDEHLILESMNEVGSSLSQRADTQVINNLNQIFVNVVRTTGSNNANRWLLVPGRFTDIDTIVNDMNGFQVPKDTVKNKIFVSVHHYDYSFGLLNNLKSSKFSFVSLTNLNNQIKKMADKFTSKGIPVIIGEFGAANKNNPADRALYYEGINRICKDFGMVACAWDDGGFDLSKDADFSMSLYDRTNIKVIHPELVNAIMRGTYLPSTKKDHSDIVKDPTVKQMTGLTLNKQTVTLAIGDNDKITSTVTPSDSNDVVLWKTSDPNIATVSNGNIRARGIGTTTITAFSQSGSINKDITVTVNAKKSVKPCTEIVTSESNISLVKGKAVFLKATMKPADTDDYLTYKSSDESVATVSTLGKVVGVAKGTTYVTITATNGLTKIIKVTVTQAEVVINRDLAVAIHVGYSDAKKEYYSTPLGSPVQIDKNGQYTVTFDCSKDLPKSAIDKGITSLSNVSVIYIKDYNVTMNKAKKSPLYSCDITYDKVVVDGVPLTITKPGPKSAIKINGIFDTNDPFNSWDGSAIKEAKDDLTNHIFSIDGMPEPKKLEVTFTISNLVFEGENKDTASVVTVDATSIKADTSSLVALAKVGDTCDISATVTPADTTSKVSFISSNPAVVAVDSKAVAVDAKTGKATRTLTAMAPGTATITAYTPEGFSSTFEVKVGN